MKRIAGGRCQQNHRAEGRQPPGGTTGRLTPYRSPEVLCVCFTPMRRRTPPRNRTQSPAATLSGRVRWDAQSDRPICRENVAVSEAVASLHRRSSIPGCRTADIRPVFPRNRDLPNWVRRPRSRCPESSSPRFRFLPHRSAGRFCKSQCPGAVRIPDFPRESCIRLPLQLC